LILVLDGYFIGEATFIDKEDKVKTKERISYIKGWRTIAFSLVLIICL
jgi:hypothetical protein